MIVSDSSPLISLARVGKLDLLHRLYGELLVPQAVQHEVVVKGVGQPGFEDVKSAVWIKTVAVTNHEFVLALQRDLDAGESEAIALALEKKADLLLMDERLGREAANISASAVWVCWAYSLKQSTGERSRQSGPCWICCAIEPVTASALSFTSGFCMTQGKVNRKELITDD